MGVVLWNLPYITLFLSATSVVAQTTTTTSIAVVTSDKSQTRLRLVRDSPESLIRKLNSDHKGSRSEDVARAPVTAHQWVALDFDFRRNEYYVLDRLKSTLLVIIDDPVVANKTQVLLEGISSKVTAIAYDWIRQVCLWTDPSFQAILSLSVSSHIYGDGSHASFGKRAVHITTIIGTGLTEPCAIAVDPVKGFLFWADDKQMPSLEMSTLEGRNRQVLTRGLIRPAGLTLDYQNNIIYWIERLSGLSVINSCLLTSLTCIPARVSIVYQSLLYDMDFHMGFLIASDLAENRLIIYDYTIGQTLRQDWFGTTYGVCVVSLERQPWIGGSRDVLTDIRKSETFEKSSTPTFKNITEHGVIFLASVQTGIFAVDRTFAMSHTPPPLFPLVEEIGITTMAVDVQRRRLFFYSQEQKSISRIDLPDTINESQKGIRTEIMKLWIKSVTGLAVDWSIGNLYWLDAGYRRIMVSRYDGRYARCVHYENITNPQGLVIDSNNRFMFWTDVVDNIPCIERSDLDGYNRMTLLQKNAFYDRPQALAIDFRKNRLYWSDGPFLCQATLMGNVLEEFRRTEHVYMAPVKAIDIMHDYVVWSDLIGGIKSADVDLDFPLTHVHVPTRFSNTSFSDVIYFHESRQNEVKNACVLSYLTIPTSSSSAIKDPHSEFNEIDKDGHVARRQYQEHVMVENFICSHLCLQSRTGPLCACATGYWLKSNGSCLPGVTVNDFLLFCDVKTGRLFRQFVLLPDYYALPLADHTHVIDVTVDDIEKKIYWIDSGRNMIHAANLDDTHHHVVLAAGHRFKMSKLAMDASHRLLYIVTKTGDLLMLSPNGYLVYVVKDSKWTIYDVTVDQENRHIYMTAATKLNDTINIFNIAMTTVGVILRADLDGSNLHRFLVTPGSPQTCTIYKGNLIWTDSKLHSIFSSSIIMCCEIFNNTTSPIDNHSVVTLARLDNNSIPDNVIVYDDVVYFTDKSKQAVQRFNLNGAAVVTSLGFPFLNEITGLNYMSLKIRRGDAHGFSCSEVEHNPNMSLCLCALDIGVATGSLNLVECQPTLHQLLKEVKVQGLCRIIPQENGSVHGGMVGDFVLSGRNIVVTCDPGFRLSHTLLQSETRKCGMGDWTSKSTCSSVLNYTVYGNLVRGYVIFNESTTFVVPSGRSEMDVICIGGGGGGYDGCDKQLRKHRVRAGMGEVSKFGIYLRANGGHGGTLHEGGRGGRGRTLFGGDGHLSSSCLGGGAAGETQSARHCYLSRTSCPFCGAGGALPSCSVCPFRMGGCSGLGSEQESEPGAADNYGGGATGTFGGGSGGGGGFSRRTIRVSSLEEILVKVGRGGIPSAKPAGSGVVVVGWGARLEDMIVKSEKPILCKPFTYTPNNEDTINYLDQCF